MKKIRKDTWWSICTIPIRLIMVLCVSVFGVPVAMVIYTLYPEEPIKEVWESVKIFVRYGGSDDKMYMR